MLLVYKNIASFLLWWIFFQLLDIFFYKWVNFYFFLIILLTFSKIFIYIYQFFFIFYRKIHTFGFIRISFTYSHLWKECTQRSNFFINFVTNEIFKILFTKRKLIRYYYFVNIYIVYRNRAFILMKFVFFNFRVIKFYNFLIRFYISF